MPATSINYSLSDSTLTVTTPDATVHDLTAAMSGGQIRLAYERTTDLAVVQVGLVTAAFIITLPNGQTITLDTRQAKALDRLGWPIPRVG